MRPIYTFAFVLGFVLTCGTLTGWTLEKDNKISAAVSFLIDRKPNHPKKGDAEYAAEVGQAIGVAADEYNQDPWDLLSMAKWESSFAPRVLSGKKKGPAGEIGLLQCGKYCAAKCPHFLDTVEGQALCGAYWLDLANKTCNAGSEAAMTYYASGQVCDWRKYEPKWCDQEDDPDACCKKEQGNLRAKVRRRINLANKLRNRFGP